MMKLIVLLLLIAGGVWAYYNVDFSNLAPNFLNSVKTEKTMKKYFDSESQVNNEVNRVKEEY